jgi:hypothetical protein
MEKIIFFALAIPILGFVFYLGGTAIMKGFKAKVDNRPDDINKDETGESEVRDNDLSSEFTKLNELYKSGVLTKDEFEKAKSKLLNN